MAPKPKVETGVVKGEAALVEDGNVDYCLVCNGGGGLLCCDKCPRAFHTKCIKINEDNLPPGDWECMRCREDLRLQKKEHLKVRKKREKEKEKERKSVCVRLL